MNDITITIVTLDSEIHSIFDKSFDRIYKVRMMLTKAKKPLILSKSYHKTMKIIHKI
jgi:hypothetical protein